MKEVTSTELRESIQVELLETKRLLEEVKDHPVMSVGLEEKLEDLEAELSEQDANDMLRLLEEARNHYE